MNLERHLRWRTALAVAGALAVIVQVVRFAFQWERRERQSRTRNAVMQLWNIASCEATAHNLGLGHFGVGPDPAGLPGRNLVAEYPAFERHGCTLEPSHYQYRTELSTQEGRELVTITARGDYDGDGQPHVLRVVLDGDQVSAVEEENPPEEDEPAASLLPVRPVRVGAAPP